MTDAKGMKPFTLQSHLNTLLDHLNELRHKQILDSDDPHYGGVVRPIYGLPDAKLDVHFANVCAYLLLGNITLDDHVIQQAHLALDHAMKMQRASGNVDLIEVNIDSGPDSAFTVQNLCHIFELAQDHSVDHPQWQPLLDKIETFIRRCIPGICSGGFHTPNHRWVIVSALVQAKAAFPDLDVVETVESYLAEGLDIDEEGFYLERSVGVYDGVNNRSLLMIGQHWDFPEALTAVQKNLTLDLHLLHSDGSAETGLSRRQDYSTREVPFMLINCYLLSHYLNPNPLFLQAAHTLWQKHQTAPKDMLWLTYALFKGGDPSPLPENVTLPTSFTRHFPFNGIWRVRRDLLSASVFQGVTRLLTLSYGQAELSSLKISHGYFGGAAGHFISDHLQVEDGQATIQSDGLGKLRRPAYELPLGKQVPPEQYNAMLAERSQNPLPPAKCALTFREIEAGFEIQYQTLFEMDNVATQLALDFPVGGIWETDNTALMPQAGQIIFLKQGRGAMRYGNDRIEINAGHQAHQIWALREAETAPNHVRVLLTFLTPVDFTFTLTGRRGL
ncbi:MAG: hypothetical protein AAF629_02400 [Chloroflexota bacterium]